MTGKILFLCTAHYSLDDRVFYHQAKSLVREGYDVYITSTKEEFSANIDGIKISSYCDNLLSQNQKKKKIVEKLTSISPDIIICDSPMSVVASSLYRKKYSARIIYDVTEWYPSKKNFPNTTGIVKWLKAIVLLSFNLLAGFKTDSFIFGEYYKSIVFRIFTFWKPFIFLPYYPDLSYIKYYNPNKPKSHINITYSGIINLDKGIYSVLKSIDTAAARCPDTHFILRIIGYFPTQNDAKIYTRLTGNLPKNVMIDQIDYLSFPKYCSLIGDTHVFLDLREKDIENTLCLPIKLYYYLACGRPVIYTNLKSIKKAIPKIDFGCLVSPNDTESIADELTKYIKNNEFYEQKCRNALRISQEHYNWSKIEKEFTSFLNRIK